MKKYQYNCTLLTDAVITSMAATEGYKESLEYIPGSKFLGIAAGKLYDEKQADRTLDLFHNGTVRYGDARPQEAEENYLKVPLSWYYEKGKSLYDKIYLHHALPENLPQLKQARSGYFSPESKKMISVEQEFSLKSEHDRKTRRSKDSHMFGYFSLKSGTEWTFTIEDFSGKYAEDIKKVIEGKHRIGRSRSAEYGLIEIKFDKDVSENIGQEFKDEIILYAKSNLAFINEVTGSYTAQPKVEQLVGTTEAEILWDKCQIRSRNYKTWNRKRFNKDFDRVIIEAGSVFVVKVNTSVHADFFSNRIGCHKNEGFGEVLINPDFLTFTDDFKLTKSVHSHSKFYAKEKGDNDEKLLNSLKKIRNQQDFNYQIDRKVNSFINDHRSIFSGISKSQWGTLRNYGKNLINYEYFKTLVFNKESGFVYRGQSENEWRKNNRRVILEKYLNMLNEEERLSFIVKLSNQMAKNKN